MAEPITKEDMFRLIKKEDFLEFEILVQFNLGFIIARRGEDLFIIDQHATDEKYNFERLQKVTVFKSQPLVKPQTLQLPRNTELTVVENLDTFARNGFKLKVLQDAPPTQKVQLLAIPFSKNTTFGADDIHDLAALLAEGEDPATVRLPKALAVFAMRACRSSIMVGRALGKDQMKTVVHHMADLKEPWNCPHGRPTMRHLFDLEGLNKHWLRKQGEAMGLSTVTVG